jgi:hypothetical protein
MVMSSPLKEICKKLKTQPELLLLNKQMLQNLSFKLTQTHALVTHAKSTSFQLNQQVHQETILFQTSV